MQLICARVEASALVNVSACECMCILLLLAGFLTSQQYASASHGQFTGVYRSFVSVCNVRAADIVCVDVRLSIHKLGQLVCLFALNSCQLFTCF